MQGNLQGILEKPVEEHAKNREILNLEMGIFLLSTEHHWLELWVILLAAITADDPPSLVITCIQ